MNELIYKCKNCQGNLVFDPTTQKLKCEYCDSYFEEEEFASEKIIRESETETAKETENNMVSYICSTCKGEIIADDTTTATFCLYCGNSTILASQFKGEFLPDAVLPFVKTEKDAKEAFLAECKRRPLCPKEFMTVDNIEKIKGVYIPFYLYDCEVDGEVLLKCTRVSTTRVGNTKLIKTDCYDVVRGGTVQFSKVPVDASSKMNDAVMDSIEPFHMKEIKSFSPAFMSGFFAERNDVSDEECFQRAKLRVDKSAEKIFCEDPKGYDSKLLSSSELSVAKKNEKLTILPVYMINTKFQDKMHIFAMNGQTGKFVGEFPVCYRRARNYFFKIAGLLYIVSILAFLLGGY